MPEGAAGPDAVWLRTPVQPHGRDLTSYAEFTVEAGERVPFVLTWRASHLPPPKPIGAKRPNFGASSPSEKARKALLVRAGLRHSQ